MPELKQIYANDIFDNEKLKRFFLKYRSKEKVLYSFTSENDIIIEEKRKRKNNLYMLKYKNICFNIYTSKFFEYSKWKYDFLSDIFISLLLFGCFIEIIFNFLMDTTYIFYFMFFDIISFILLFFDIFLFEKYFFDFFIYFTNGLFAWKKIEKDYVIYLIQLFKSLRIIKIYRLVINFIKKHTKEKYKHRNEWNFEKMESMKNRPLKESLKFTNKMHLALIKRYFMSLIFIMLSYIMIEIIYISKESKNPMNYFIYNLDLIVFDEFYEKEFLKALYFYSTIQKNKSDEEYLISIKSKRKLQNFINRKEIDISGINYLLWDFSNLSHNNLLKFVSPSSASQNVEEEIILDHTIKNLNELRYFETKIYESKDFIFYINIKRYIERIIKNIIILKIFIIIFSFIILFYFTCELNVLLFPIESILKKLKLMKSNPTLALEMQEELLNHELKNILINTKLKRKSIKENYEILKMEENLMKLGTLMLLGFGEAGAKIISKNINEQERVNLLINGEIVYSVFSFCDIRNFTEITEVLKEKIMIFINLIAEIIHECCDFYGGTINKNIGDAFLLVWKYQKKEFSNKKMNIFKSPNNNYDEYSEKENINRICDLAFLSTVQTLIKLRKSEKIHIFLNSENMDELIKNNILELSFGLHFGWAIEGAIGSSYKIDLSYLSENVNIASRLQEISKIYKNNIVISGDFYDNMSEKFKNSLRKIDRVTLKGCRNPLSLYTFDICLNKITKKVNMETFDANPHFDIKLLKVFDDIKKKAERKKRKKEVLNLSYNLYEEYARNDDIKFIKIQYPKDYLEQFKIALESYLIGKWNVSKNILEYLKKNNIFEDQIVNQLWSFLSVNNFLAPSDWCGYRKFLQKS
ncbi:adenylyl cyclase alpha [Plasmodium gaboni]|uniref:Adenylyl cyclase alpha n=1 Tax=Plasmodium gaboni TaxID=647221 RepID=A0ABY1UT19_9APIC|nr:adenylyl cyclase alpha [Plasmodium gaboni]